MRTKKETKQKKLSIGVIKNLQSIALPKGWEIAKLTVEFIKRDEEMPINSLRVAYDGSNGNDCFYAKTSKGYIYPEEENDVRECLDVMKKANTIIKQK